VFSMRLDDNEDHIEIGQNVFMSEPGDEGPIHPGSGIRSLFLNYFGFCGIDEEDVSSP
jgi:hypothetical protein